jgi:hypothetical protein
MQRLGVEQPDSTPDLIVPRVRANSWVFFSLALGIVVPALIISALDGAFDDVATLVLVGLPSVVWTGRNAIMNTPLLHASEQGLRFGGGNLVPWRAVTMIGECDGNLRSEGTITITSAVSIYFSNAKTIFQLPVSYWIASILSNGDIDVSILATKQTAGVIAAHLDARRRYAHSLESGESVGVAALPAARVNRSD